MSVAAAPLSAVLFPFEVTQVLSPNTQLFHSLSALSFLPCYQLVHATQYICGLYQHQLRATTVLWRKNNTVAQLADLSELEK